MQVLNIFHVLIAIALIAFVLIQKGQGATAGAAFGSGASGTVFGARGAGNFLTRSTWVLAGLFCVISLTMAIVVSRMMDAPDAGLGVVGNEQPVVSEVQAVEESVPEQSLISADESATSDVPAFAPAAEDLPEVDSAADLPPAADAGDGQPEDPGNG